MSLFIKVDVAGWQQAFAAHPRIGDIEGLRKKFGGFADMSKNEQASSAGASAQVIEVYPRSGKTFMHTVSSLPAALCTRFPSSCFVHTRVRDRD